MKHPKLYARGKHAVAEAQKYAPHAVLKVFEDAKGETVAQISSHRLIVPYGDFTGSLSLTQKTGLILLAGIEDPHNVGAIIRSAAAFGAAGVLVPPSGQVPLTDTVLKVSAGMAFRIPIVEIEGYQQALSDLRRRGFEIVALDQRAGTALSVASFTSPAVFIVGNEGAGIPNAVRPLVTTSLKIPMDARAESLNVAAAVAVTLYDWSSKTALQ